MAQISTKAVDCILHNLASWKTLVSLLEPKTSTSIVLLPVVRSWGSAVERVAIERAALSTVLDVVEQSLNSLPPDLRKVARMKYEQKMSHFQIAKCLNWSKKTIDRRVNQIRQAVAGNLMVLGGERLSQFWPKIDSILSQLSG